MAYELAPKDGSPPHAAKAVADLLAAEFRCVERDVDEGMKRAHSLADWYEAMADRVFKANRQDALAHAEALRKLAWGDAMTITFGDDADALLRTTVMPGDTVRIGFGSNEAEAAARPLVERAARVLGYGITVF